jgi:hypothetical protein
VRLVVTKDGDTIVGGDANNTFKTPNCSHPMKQHDEGKMRCMCRPGFHRSPLQEEECESCPEGTHTLEMNLKGECSVCDAGTYSFAGATRCSTCPSSGATCTSGILRILPNYWCEACELAHTLAGINYTTAAVNEHQKWVLNTGKENVTLETLLNEVVVVEDSTLLALCGAGSNCTVAQALKRNPLLLLGEMAGMQHQGVALQECAVPKACSMNEETGAVSCSEGHEGPLCGTCKAGYSRPSLVHLCSPCWPQWQNWLVTGAVFAAMVALVVVASWGPKRMPVLGTEAHPPPSGTSTSTSPA